MNDARLVAHYGEVMGELHRRGIVRSGNNPIADMAESVIAAYEGVDPEPPNTKSYDVVTKRKKMIQVKALRKTKPSRTGLSPLRTLDFDILAAVIFSLDMQLIEAVYVPVKTVEKHMSWSKTWGCHRLSVTKKSSTIGPCGASRPRNLWPNSHPQWRCELPARRP